MNWVDVLVLVLALLAGISGARQGMVTAAASFIGVLTGAVIGVGENGASTSGNPETSNSLVSSDGRSRSTLGMIVSTIRSTDESRTAPVRPV